MIRIKYNNKGMMALNQLIGILLSAMALMMLFVYFIMPLLLYTPTNLGVAKSNADSIKNFIDYSSSGDYGSLKDCFTTIRLHHLENYQFKRLDVEETYFYVIGDNNVYVLHFDNYDNFLKSKSVRGLYVYKTDKFESGNLDLVVDETKQGSFFSASVGVEILPFIGTEFSFGKTEGSLSINRDAKYLLLKPIFKQEGFGTASKVLQEKYSQNLLEGYWISENDVDIAEGMMLAYKNEDKKLFLTNGVVSNSILNSGLLCSVQYLYQRDLNEIYLQKDENGNYLNLKDVPYNEKKLVFKFKLNDNSYSDYMFEWAGKGFCKFNGGDCDLNSLIPEVRDVYDNILNADDPYNFQMYCERFFSLFNHGVVGEGEFKLEDLEEGEFDDLNIKIKFKDVFREYIDSDSGESINVYTLDNEVKKGSVFSIKNWGGLNSVKFNGVESSYSNDVMYFNGKTYFYVQGSQGSARYYAFQSHWLRKRYNNGENIEFFLNGEKLELVKRIEADAYGISLPILDKDDNKVFYWIRVPIEGKKYDVIISANQLGGMLVN